MRDYWSMSDDELIAEAHKYKIPYINHDPVLRLSFLDRPAVIEQLCKRDIALAAQKMPPPNNPPSRRIGF